jgi:hypothetical protein
VSAPSLTRSQLSSHTRSHVRQLLYIALYPPSPTWINHKSTQESPSKLSSRHAYSALLPSPSASELAKRTLRVLADVNSPASLLRALPAYPDPNDTDDAPPDFDPELPSDVDSFVASEARRLRNCKNCWNILKFGFIQSLADGSSTVPRSPRKRRRGNATAADLSPVNEEETSLVVGENAWPVLDWLLVLFEKDESMAEASQQGSKYCHLFLVAVIPLTLHHKHDIRLSCWRKYRPRGVTQGPNGTQTILWRSSFTASSSRKMRGVPWEDVYSTSFVPRYFHSMRRLIRFQLINLASTNLFDLPLFMNLLIPRLPSGALEMRELLSGMSSTPTICKFKLALCQRYLTRACVGSNTSKGRGRPRAQPRPISARKRVVKQDPTVLTVSDIKPDISPLSTQNQHALPPPSELLHLLAMKTNANALSNIVKYDLIVTYGILQHQMPAEGRSQDWTEMLQSGRVEEAAQEAFGDSDDQQSSIISQKILFRMISTWR